VSGCDQAAKKGGKVAIEVAHDLEKHAAVLVGEKAQKATEPGGPSRTTVKAVTEHQEELKRGPSPGSSSSP
jgi:hypothetical protein